MFYTGDLPMKSIDEIKVLISEHKQELRENFKVKEISIFGSYARGEQENRSDIDLLVDFTELISLLKLVGLENYLKDILEEEVEVIPKDDIRTEFKERILKEAIPV
jgi:predicted nucleotidyltransferase